MPRMCEVWGWIPSIDKNRKKGREERRKEKRENGERQTGSPWEELSAFYPAG